jgi:hypothetical protein
MVSMLNLQLFFLVSMPNSAFMLLLIYDIILNTLRDERPNLVDVLESRFHSY